MTSTNDGKEVKSYQTSGLKGKTYFIELYKSLEARLNESVSASERTKTLCEAWRRVHSLCLHSTPDTHLHLTRWLLQHTARVVLQTKWPTPERKYDRLSLEEAINVFIVESRTSAASREAANPPPWETELVARGEWFKRVLDHPWKHPVLNCLLNPNGTPPTNDEVLEWLKEESGVTFVMRLHTLVAEKCDDIAVTLAAAVMERVRGTLAPESDAQPSDNHKDKLEKTASNFADRLKKEADFTSDVLDLLIDIEFVLLHKLDSSKCIALAKQTPLCTAYQLIERLQNRLGTSPREKKLWKNSKEVAILIAQVVITRCMVSPACAGGVRVALYCCARSLARLSARARLPAACAALAAPAPTAAHLHTLAAAVDAQLIKENDVSMRPFVCELYVRAITAGMNELERLKLTTEKETEARSMEQTLASWFVQLGAVLACSERVKCECALTAFSLHPSPQMYDGIKAAPALPAITIPDAEETSRETNPEFGSWASDSRSQTNFVKTSETLKMKARQNQANVLSTAILTEGETLGLSPELCQDITVLLSGPRVKILSWDMDRELLLENCRAYLERTHGGTRAVTTELKYLNLNPADFQYLPEEEDDESNIYYGIEKGYEHLVEFQEPEDIWEDACEKADNLYFEKAETSSYSDEFNFVQPQRKKKTKKPATNSDDDDPLSYVAEIKNKEKKERPHSKERSKDKKKITDLLEKKESGDPLEFASQELKKEKSKKERKKKVPKPTNGSLANLVGLKVGKPKKSTIAHQDSDAESQGCSSVRSLNSDESVLYDGVFSMDDMRSPRSSHSSESIGVTQDNESSMGNEWTGQTQPRIALHRPYRPTSASGRRIASPSPAQSPSDRNKNDSPIHSSEEVKHSLAKLLEYRRQKTLEDHKKPNAIIRPHSSTSMNKINISPKGVAIPEIPKSYISKKADMTMLKQTSRNMNQNIPDTAIPSRVIQYASKATSPEKPSQARYNPNQYHNTGQADQLNQSDRCYSTPPSADKFLDSVNLISIYDNNEPTHSRYSYNKTTSSPEVSLGNRRQTKPNTSYINYQDYLHEFSLDAYNQYLEKRDAGMKDMRSASSMSHVVPNTKSEHKSPLSAKQMPQKKPDGSLNTFSRMSYYKNKQTDFKKSQDMRPVNSTHDSKLQTVGSKLDDFIMDHLLQTQTPTSVNSQTSPNNVHALIGNHEKPQTMTTVRDHHPLLSNILQGNLSKTQVQQRTVSPAKSVLSDKDQNDLLLLLRQQNALNKPQMLPVASSSNRDNTLNSPVACGFNTSTSTTNAIYDSNDPSTSIPKHNKNHKKVAEGKMINVISTSIVKSADQKPTNLNQSLLKNIKKPIGDPFKKTKNRVPNKIAPKPEPRKKPEEWENVLNAISKQKTPCRGPNALDVALNKSSFEKAFEDSLRKPSSLFIPKMDRSVESTIISQTESIRKEFVNSSQSMATSITATVTQTKKTTYTPLKIPHHESLLKKKSSKPKKSVATPSSRNSSGEKIIKQQQIENKMVKRVMQHDHIEITEHTSSITVMEIPEVTSKHSSIEKSTKIVEQHHIETSKINVQQNHIEIFKKSAKQHHLDLPKKHASQICEKPKKEIKLANTQSNQSNSVGLKKEDLFMSGIPNSDYDVLDELMDDDLRKEISELSDEETYPTQSFMKIPNSERKPNDVTYRAVNIKGSKTPISSPHQQMSKQNETQQSTAQNYFHSKESEIISPPVPAQNIPIVRLNAPTVQNSTTQAHACNSTSLLYSAQTPVDTNLYYTVPCPAPVQNMMLIPSQLVNESYPSAHSSMQVVPSLSTNTYITVTNAPSINLYQTTPFVTPVATPLLIPSAVETPVAACTVDCLPIPTTKLSETEYCYSSDEMHRPSHLATSKGNIVVDGNKLELKSPICNLNIIEKDMLPNAVTKIIPDDNEGINNERKVLKEVQEKHTVEKIDCKRKSQNASVKDLKTQADLERLRKKRMAILNRKILNVCGIHTIALGYSSLQLSSEVENKDFNVAHADHSMNDQTPSNEPVHEVINEVNSPATPDSFKENKHESTQVRRILLRSSNKLKSKISSSSSPKPSPYKKLRKSSSISSNTSSETPSENDQSDIEIKDKQKRVIKRIRNNSITSTTDSNNEESKAQVEAQKKPTEVSKLYDKKAKNVSSEMDNQLSNINFETEERFDIETELLSSTIRKTETINSNISKPKINPRTSVGEKILESFIADMTEFESLPDANEDQVQQIAAVNQSPKPHALEDLCKQSIPPTENVNVNSKPEETIEINDNLLMKDEISNKTYTRIDINQKLNVDALDKDIISKAKHSIQRDKIQMDTSIKSANSFINVISVETDSTPEIKPPIEIDNIISPQKTHTIPIDIANKEIIQTLDKSGIGANKITAQVEQTNESKKVEKTVNLNKSHVVMPQSQVGVAENDDDDIQIVEEIPKITRIDREQNNSSIDSIIEEPGVYDDNPLQKKIRIKLANGKVFKGTVSGSVDVTNLLDNPQVKSLLMSQFVESKKHYTLKLNVSKNCTISQILPTKLQLPVETVSLLSDDEEDDTPKMFETEYGKHKIAPMNSDLFKKHQRKFMAKSYVPVKKLSLAHENTIKSRSRTKTNSDTKVHISKKGSIIGDLTSPPSCIKKLDDAEIISAIPSKYVRGIFNDIENILTPTNVQRPEEPIVLIDDSSNDSIDIKNKPETTEKIDELKNMLLKDLGVDDLLSSTNDASDDVQVTWDSEAIDLTDDPVFEPIKHKVPTLVSEYNQSVNFQFNRKCFVKLVRCDKIVTSQPKCQVSLVQDDESKNKDIILAQISRPDSPSILEDLSTAIELNKNTPIYKQNRSSPVMEVYDLMVSLDKKILDQNPPSLTAVRVDCYSEWMTTKKEENMQSYKVTVEHLEQSFAVPHLTALVLSYIQKEDLVNKISLKRKSMSSVSSIAKISKLENSTDYLNFDDRSCSTFDLAATHTSKSLISEDERIIEDLDATPDLSDTEVTNMTFSDNKDKDYMALITGAESENLNKINVTVENKLAKCNSMVNTLENLTKEHSSIKINENLAKDTMDFLDDIPIDISNLMMQMEEPVPIKTELVKDHKDYDDNMFTVNHNDNEKVLIMEASTDSHDINPDLPKGFTAETFVELSMNCFDDISVDLNSQKKYETPSLKKFDPAPAHEYVENRIFTTVCRNDRETVLENKVDAIQKESMSDSNEIHPYPSECFINEFSKEDTASEILKATSATKISTDRADVIRPCILKSDLVQAHKYDTNTEFLNGIGNGKVLEKLSECQNSLTIDSLSTNSDSSKDCNVEFTKEISNKTSLDIIVDRKNDMDLDLVKKFDEPVLIKTDLEQVYKVDGSNTVCYNHNGTILVNKAVGNQNMSMVDSFAINLDPAEIPIEYNKNISIDLDNLKQIEEPIPIKSNLVTQESHSAVCYKYLLDSKMTENHNLSLVETLNVSSDLCSSITGITEENVLSERSTSAESLVRSITDDTSVDFMKQIKEKTPVKIDVVEGIIEKVENAVEAENKESVTISDCNVIKYINEEKEQNKDLIFSAKQNLPSKEFDTTNIMTPAHPEILSENTTGCLKNPTDSMHELLIDTSTTALKVENDNQLSNDINFSKVSSSDDMNYSDEIDAQQHSKSEIEYKMNENYDGSEYIQVSINNSKNTKIVKTTEGVDRQLLANKSLKNKCPLIRNAPEIAEHSTTSILTHSSGTNGKTIGLTHTSQVSTNKDSNKSYSKRNESSVEHIKFSESANIDYVTNDEKPNESKVAYIPKTTHEIVAALNKMFGEPDDSVLREMVTSSCENSIPNHTDMVLNSLQDPNNDAVNVSLQKGVLLVEEPECDTVIEGIVDMLSDEIIDDVTLDTLRLPNERNVTEVQEKNLNKSTVLTRDDECEKEEITEINETGNQIKEYKENISKKYNTKEIEDIKLMIPKHTYSYSKNVEINEIIRKSSRNMKRKKDMSDVKTAERKYRKGKNIDYPKITALAISELAYAKEYKRIIDYCSTIKFSYARPFHIESIDVEDMLKAWPVAKCSTVVDNNSINAEDLLFKDTEDTENFIITDPFKRTLNEEIVSGENITKYKSIDINETNFNMGFGERSGRVIQKIETGIIKLSAATLSDVKQYQPFLMSEMNEVCYSSLAREIDTQKVKLTKFNNLINMKRKVQSFFKKIEFDLIEELRQNKKNMDSDRQLSKYPFCLTSTEFMKVPQKGSVVNVVQVGQSPVSATVQNSMTCDPRVTHVSDASPQCSDNSTGEDTHSTVGTEYTELTTANITLPLVHEYALNRQQSPPSHDQNLPETKDDPNESFSIVKIELMEETSQENHENDNMYDTDFSPLPNNNIEYSFEDTSNTLFNSSGQLNTSKSDSTSSNVFNTSNNMDTFTNMFDHSANIDSAYSTNTPSSTESTYTNMESASTTMYCNSPNIGNSSTEMNKAVNMNEASASTNDANNTYPSTYNSMENNSNDMDDTAHMNGSSTDLENTTTNMNSTSIENASYDYGYENIEDYAANIENNNNYTAHVDNFDAVENYSGNVDDYTSNVESYASNNESYRAGVEKYASSIENYDSNIENYTTNVENYSNNVKSANSSNNNNQTNNTTANISEEPTDLSMTDSVPDSKICTSFEDSESSKSNQIGHAMNAAGIAAESVITSGADELATLLTHTTSNNYSKSTPINVMTLQQALAHVLPPPLNQTSPNDNPAPTSNSVPQQVLHIVQGNNAQTVINKPNGTHLLHIVQNKNNAANNGLSLVDTGLQQGGNQLIHIVNNGNQNNAQFLKRVNLLTNLTNAQGSNEQKMIQLVCKSADGKSIQLNAGHQRSMVLRLHPTTVQAAPKPTEPQDLSAASSQSSSDANVANSQDPSQDIKSRSVYEENYAQFIQNSGPAPGSSSTVLSQEKATSLPKFNQVFGKQSYQENQNEINNGLQRNSDCQVEENNAHLEQTPEVNNPPLVVRNTTPETTQAQPSSTQQIKQTISPMNIHTTMHGGVIYTRQIPVNIGGRQTINLITVPSTDLVDDSVQKQQSDNHFASQEGEQSSIIKLVPHHTANSNVPPEENNAQASTSSETNQTPQPVLTQMRIKLPMLSKGPIVPGARLVRPSFFQIQRNVIAGTNQPVYQQLVLTTAPPLGQTIRLPTQQAQSPQGPPLLVQTSQHPQPSPHIPVQQVQHAPSSQHLIAQQTHSVTRPVQSHSVPPELTKPETVPESELSTLTLEQLREFDMVLEQVKERSVQPTPSTTPIANSCTPADSTDGPAMTTTSVSESTQQVLHSVDNSHPTNVVSYVNRKSTITSATTSFVRSPDSSGIVDAPSSSTQVQITHTVTSKSSTADGGSTTTAQPKKKKKKKSSSSSNTLAALGSPSKTNALKPQEDEQTTQRILYILAEYKEQVENSPDKNKPAPRRRNQFPPTIGSKRKRHCSSRSTCRREGVDMSPMHGGEPGELGDDLITLGSEDSSCGTTFSECTDCQEIHSPDSPTKVVRRLTFEQETTTQITQTQNSQQPQRNVIVGDRQTITVARTTTATTAKPTTTVLMPANYLLPVSMLKGGQQIAIMTNRGPKILVGAGDNNAGALLFQRLIAPGLKPVLTRPGVRHIRLPATALHNLQAFNIQTTPVAQAQPPDSTAPQAPMPGPPDLIDMRPMSSPWQDRGAQDKTTRGPSPDCTEPWNLPSSSIADDYGYEEIVRTDNMERTVLVVQQRKDGRHHRVTHVSTAALRHKYAILEHELRLQKSLSEECEDLGVDSPSASELFPEADILFGAPSPAHEQTIDQCNTPPLIPIQPTIPQPDLDDQIATDQLLAPTPRNDELDLSLDDVGEIVTVGEDGIATIPTINAEEFARSHPNTTFHTEPEDSEITPFTIAQSIKGRHITFHANRVPGTVVMAPQTTVISQATINTNEHNTVKFIDIDNMINSMPCPQPVVQSVLVKDPGKQAKLDTLKEPSTSGHKPNPKFDGPKSSGKSVPKISSKYDVVKDSIFTPKTKFDSVKDPGTSHRPSSKFDYSKDAGSSKPSSKFDSSKEPGVSTLRSSTKFDSLKDPSVPPRSVSKFDSLKDPTGSRSYSKFDSLKETGSVPPKTLSKFDTLLTESKLQLSNTAARQVLHSTGHGTQVIRRLRYDDRTNARTNTKFHSEEPRRRNSISDEVKLRNDRAMVESMGDNASSPGHPELFWDSTTTDRNERRFQFNESEKVTKSPFDELLNDSSAYGPHTRLDSVIKAARPERTYERTSFEGLSISGSSDESRPLRTYPPKRAHTQHTQDSERHFTLKTTTTTTHHHEVERSTTKTAHHHEMDRTKKTRCQESEGRRRTGRGLVKRGCSCCNGSQSAPPKKRSRPKKTPQELAPDKAEPLT